MSVNPIRVNAQDPLMVRFWNHAQLGLSKNIQEHKRNWVEKTGDAILWTVEDFPGIAWGKMKEPRVVTVALTQMALIANSFLFYPSQSWEVTKNVIHWLPLPSLATIRFGVYVSTCSLIIGASLRAYGRFSNQELMANFYAKAQATHPANKKVK